ncbi:hypothetical protein ABH14_20210 [Brevibacillus brevis]|uniref:hypothetical protein n=1 Tax=Brevibacillus brevis TaxID=1393 RepID=UPI0018FFB2ED|nr:hypothetical protein [Brevibacillus brevis]MBH0332048.1 hypothetical protein [Brevibacillus brevis]
MTKSDKIALLNTLHRKFEDWECDEDTGYSVTIRLDKESRHVLNGLAVDDQYVQLNHTEGEEGSFEMDIAPIGFQNCGAVRWDSFMGFIEERT